jgi:hypothetical protein
MLLTTEHTLTFALGGGIYLLAQVEQTTGYPETACPATGAAHRLQIALTSPPQILQGFERTDTCLSPPFRHLAHLQTTYSFFLAFGFFADPRTRL